MAAMITGVLAGMINQIPYLCFEFNVNLNLFQIIRVLCWWFSSTLILCAPFLVFRQIWLLFAAPVLGLLLASVSILPGFIPYIVPSSLFTWLDMFFKIITPIQFLIKVVAVSFYMTLVYKARPLSPPLWFGLIAWVLMLIINYLSLFLLQQKSGDRSFDTIVIILFLQTLITATWVTLPAWKIESMLRTQYRKEHARPG